jgi:hypothetical protein
MGAVRAAEEAIRKARKEGGPVVPAVPWLGHRMTRRAQREGLTVCRGGDRSLQVRRKIEADDARAVPLEVHGLAQAGERTHAVEGDLVHLGAGAGGGGGRVCGGVCVCGGACSPSLWHAHLTPAHPLSPIPSP